MNLNFLEAVKKTQPQEDTTPWNSFQSVYAMLKDAYEEICEAIEEALKNNHEYKEKMRRASSLPEDARQSITNYFRKLEREKRMVVFDEIRQFYLTARNRLLTGYGAYITAKIACPEEIVNLFMPAQLRKIIGQPLEDQLVELAMLTHW